MNANKIVCRPIGGQPQTVARTEYHKPTPQPERRPVTTFGQVQCRQLGDHRMIAQPMLATRFALF